MPIVRRIAFLLAAVTSLIAYDHSALADTGPCRSIEYERAMYAVCEVEVRADGKVIFVISEEAVSFDALARLFRDALNCPNALFLDGGSASSLYAPTLNRPTNIVPLGPMLAVFEAIGGTPQR
jgi:uncharacterized protein YigE (DUF2233 family)